MAHWDVHGSGLLHVCNAHLAMDGNTNDVMTREDVLLDAYILSTVIQQPGYQNRCVSHCGDCVEEEGLPCNIVVLGMFVTVIRMSVIHSWMWHIACS